MTQGIMAAFLAITAFFSLPHRGSEIEAERAAGEKRATRLALDALGQAAVDKLPRFYYRVQYRHGIVDSMRAIDVSFDNLKQALTAPVLQADWFGWYETSFSWDEKQFLWERLPGPGIPNKSSRFWTTSEAWRRAQGGRDCRSNLCGCPGLPASGGI
jgi:hypothetical protein